MSFDIGQKVVCVDDVFSPSIIKLLQQVPVKGKVYVVRDVKIGFLPVSPAKQREGGVRVLLIGLVNPNADDGQEHGFNAERFRPLEEVRGENGAKEGKTATLLVDLDSVEVTEMPGIYTVKIGSVG